MKTISVKSDYFSFNNINCSSKVSFKTVSGEGNSCTAEMTAPWKETTLPTILSKYKLDEIYNADEFGLFFVCSRIISHSILDLSLA